MTLYLAGLNGLSQRTQNIGAYLINTLIDLPDNYDTYNATLGNELIRKFDDVRVAIHGMDMYNDIALTFARNTCSLLFKAMDAGEDTDYRDDTFTFDYIVGILESVIDCSDAPSINVADILMLSGALQEILDESQRDEDEAPVPTLDELYRELQHKSARGCRELAE